MYKSGNGFECEIYLRKFYQSIFVWIHENKYDVKNKSTKL